MTINSNIEFLKMGLIYGRIRDESKGIFALNLNKEKKSGSFTIMKVKINSQGNLSSQRNTAILKFLIQYYFYERLFKLWRFT